MRSKKKIVKKAEIISPYYHFGGGATPEKAEEVAKEISKAKKSNHNELSKPLTRQEPTPPKIPAISSPKIGKYKLKSSFSFNAKNEVEDEKEAELISGLNKPKNPFTIDELKGKWKSYCYSLQNQKLHGLYSTLTKHDIELRDDFTIILKLDNEIQVVELQNKRVELLNCLREGLNNFSIKLETEVSQDQTKSTHLTSKDKFNLMAEKNKHLQALKQKLGLDIEY